MPFFVEERGWALDGIIALLSTFGAVSAEATDETGGILSCGEIDRV